MYRSHEILVQALKQYRADFVINDYHAAEKINKICYPEGFGLTPSPNELWVISPDTDICDFSQTSGNFLVFLDSAGLADEVTSDTANLFLIPVGTNPMKVLKTVAACLEALDRMARNAFRLLDLSMSRDRLKETVEMAAEMLGNPVALFDMINNRFLAYSQKEIAEDPYWTSLVYEEKRVSEVPSISERVKSLDTFFDGLSEPTIIGSGKDAKRRLLAGLWEGGICHYAFVMLENHRIFSEADTILLKMIMNYLGDMLRRQFPISHHFKEQNLATFFDDCVQGRLNQEAIQRTARSLQLTIEDSSELLMVFHKNKSADYVDLMNLYHDIQKKASGATAFIYDFAILVLSGNSQAQTGDKIAGLLDTSAERCWKIAVSLPFTSAVDLKYAYQQCKAAAHYGQGSPSVLLLYRDYMMFDLMELASKQTNLRNYVLPTALQMVSYDAAHETELALTLFVYLKNYCDRSRVAEKLHIHLNSVGYRMRKMEELFGIDFNDYSTLRALETSLNILLLREQRYLP